MKCREQGCEQPVLYVGLKPDRHGEPHLLFMCRNQHRWSIPLNPVYKEWIEDVIQTYDRLRNALLCLPSPPEPKLVVDTLVGELMAPVANLVALRPSSYTAAPEEQAPAKEDPAKLADPYTIYTDGSCDNPGPGGWGIVVEDKEGNRVHEESWSNLVDLTNNEAEYLGITEALRWAREHGIRNLAILSDSELCVKQLDGTYETREPRLAALRLGAIELMGEFDRAIVKWIPGDGNPAHDLAEEGYRRALKERGIVKSTTRKKRKKR